MNVADCINTLRLFVDSVDFSEDHGSGWVAGMFLFYHENLSLTYERSYVGDAGMDLPLQWLIRNSTSDITEISNFNEHVRQPIRQRFAA